MKNIEIKQLSLSYFKGIESLTIPFPTKTTAIYGRNATGKTSIVDAFMWLFFNKDSQGNSDSNFDLKTIEKKGVKYIPEIDHTVEAVLLIDGVDVILKKTLREKWTRKRGGNTTEFTGNETICYIDDVAVSVTEYNKYISSIISEDLFKLLTSPSYYNGLHWEKRRGVLMSMVGDVSASTVPSLNSERFISFVSLSDEDIAKEKARIAQKKKTINDELKLIPARIDEVKRAMPVVDEDIEVLRTRKKEQSKTLSEINDSIANFNTANVKIYEQIGEMRKAISQIEASQYELLKREQEKVDSASVDTELNALISKKQELSFSISREKGTINSIQADVNTILDNVSSLEKKKGLLASEYTEIKDSSYVETPYTKSEDCLICPLYKHKCTDATALQSSMDAEEKQIASHEEWQKKEMELFNTNKANKLKQINENGHSIVAQIATLRKDVELKLKEIESKKEEVSSLEKTLLSISTTIEQSKPSERIIITAENCPGYSDKEHAKKELLSKIEEISGKVNSHTFDDDRIKATEALNATEEKLRLYSQIDILNIRIDELHKMQKSLSQALADEEKNEQDIFDFYKEKMLYVENTVNSMFEDVKFKLFAEQINGGEVAICDTLVSTNGSWVPYKSANNAGKINAGLEIINKLQDFYQTTAPVFIDNAESVNVVKGTHGQAILLLVSNDASLIFKNL